MKKHFNYDFTNQAIVGSKAAINRANKGMNPEYTELTRMLAAQPTYKVVEKAIKTNDKKQKYSNLTFDRMEEYIKTLTDSSQKLIELEAVKKVAAAKGAKYPLTKKWFLAKYPEYKEHNITEEDTKNLINQEQKKPCKELLNTTISAYKAA